MRKVAKNYMKVDGQKINPSQLERGTRKRLLGNMSNMVQRGRFFEYANEELCLAFPLPNPRISKNITKKKPTTYRIVCYRTGVQDCPLEKYP